MSYCREASGWGTSSSLRAAGARLADLRHLGWDVGVRFMERVAGHRRGDSLDFRLKLSARDLLREKGKAMRDEVEALAQTVVRAGYYPKVEDASKAVDAVLDALRDRVPPEVLMKLSEYLSEGEAARLRAGIRQRLRREEGFSLVKPES